jgi:hypothetical protein
MNAGIDNSAEFLVLKRSAIFVDQSSKLVKQEVVTLDVVIEFFKGILRHKSFEPRMAQMTRRGRGKRGQTPPPKREL